MPALSQSPTTSLRRLAGLRPDSRSKLINTPLPSRPTHNALAQTHPLGLRPFSSSSSAHSPLAGTAPHHTAYVLLHTHRAPSDPAYPARSKSPLWRALTLRAREWGGVVNFAWSDAPPLARAVHPAYTGLGEPGGPGGQHEREAYVASVFSTARRARFEIPEVTLDSLDGVRECCLGLGARAEGAGSNGREPLYVYVCTHGSRDCRCGDTGGEVVRAFRSEIARRGVGRDVVLSEVAHVGGHKYAANVLVYPYGEWLGTVQAFDVPQVLDEVLDWHSTHRDATSTAELPPLCPVFWRGRMGLDKEQQLALIARKAA